MKSSRRGVSPTVTKLRSSQHSSSDAQLQVIGASFGRTGTVTVQKALDILGMPCYHFGEILRHPEHIPIWERLFAQSTSALDEVMALFKSHGYVATMDHPCCDYYKELLAKNPGAKVILTEHPGGDEAWMRSRLSLEALNFVLFSWWLARPLSGLLMSLVSWMWATGTSSKLTVQSLAAFLDKVDAPVYGPMAAREHGKYLERLQQRRKEVLEVVAPEQLLIFSPSEGWAPLCRFLEKPIPDVPFPREDFHGTANIRRTILKVKLCVVAIYLAAFLLLMLAYSLV